MTKSLQTLALENLRKTLSKGALKLSQPAGCKDVSLYLFDPAVLEGPIPHEEAQAVVAEPAYWSFCWASGQVLAQFILENPQWVKGKTVVDVGCGSGIVAIAAGLAGAKNIIACDLDPDALIAARANAQANDIEIKWVSRLSDIDIPIDLITAADVLYDRDNFPLLDEFRSLAKTVLLADSRVKQLPSKHYTHIETKHARTWPDLNEFEEFNQVRLYHG